MITDTVILINVDVFGLMYKINIVIVSAKKEANILKLAVYGHSRTNEIKLKQNKSNDSDISKPMNKYRSIF